MKDEKKYRNNFLIKSKHWLLNFSSLDFKYNFPRNLNRTCSKNNILSRRVFINKDCDKKYDSM